MIYPFRCNKCKKEFELEMSHDVYMNRMLATTTGVTKYFEPFKCTKCGSTNVQRNYHVSIAPIHFIGDGFTKSTSEE